MSRIYRFQIKGASSVKLLNRVAAKVNRVWLRALESALATARLCRLVAPDPVSGVSESIPVGEQRSRARDGSVVRQTRNVIRIRGKKRA